MPRKKTGLSRPLHKIMRFNVEELDALKKKAARRKMNVSEYIRFLIEKDRPK